MALARDRAICLRRLDYSETSQILAVFTRDHGLLRVIAKGAKRTTKAGNGKFDGGLDLLDLGEAAFIHAPEKEMTTLTEWSLIDGHLNLRDSLRGMYLAQYAAELIGMLLEEHDAHPNIFDDLEALLPRLAGERLEEAFLVFQLRFLHAAGVLPDFSQCVHCDTATWGPAIEGAPEAFFSPTLSGVICPDCEAAGLAPDRLPIDPRLLRLCDGLGRNILPKSFTGPRLAFHELRPPRLTRAHTDPINRLLVEHIKHSTQRAPRLASYIFRPHTLVARSATSTDIHAPGTRVVAPPRLDSPPTHGTAATNPLIVSPPDRPASPPNGGVVADTPAPAASDASPSPEGDRNSSAHRDLNLSPDVIPSSRPAVATDAPSRADHH